MFRHVLYTLAALAVLLVPMGLTAEANAGWHAEFRHHHRSQFNVFYRSCNREPWLLYRTACSRHDARELAQSLRCRGLQVYVAGCY